MMIARTALEAWTKLNECGLEVDGRDTDLAELLRARLDPNAPSLIDALNGSTTNAFVCSFFAIATPFVDMLRGILGFFEKAQAQEGPAQWNVAFEGVLPDLEAFKKALHTAIEVSQAVECPALTWEAGWKLKDALQESQLVDDAICASFGSDFQRLDPLVAPWVARYAKGTIGPLPRGLQPGPTTPPWLRKVWSCILLVHARLNAGGFDRKSAKEYSRSIGFRQIREDAFALESVCQSEPDCWLRSLLVAYATVLKSERCQAEVQPAVEAVIDTVPTVMHAITTQLESVETFISLPIWRKRHEIYAAWVATEMVQALGEHDVVVAHEDGRITLPFRETVVATVPTAWPPRRLMAERRVPLMAPKGKGRSAAVQPDYSWWRKDGQDERAELVVEVKHYKKAAAKKWTDVLDDYARAHPGAQIVLVNYGPAGNAANALPPDLTGQCQVIGYLSPASAAARSIMSGLVREAVGQRMEPLNTSQVLAQLDDSEDVIALDVSASMTVTPERARSLVCHYAAANRSKWISGVDTEVRGKWLCDDAGFDALLSLARNQGTELNRPVASLLSAHRSVTIVTDKEGFETLSGDYEVETLEEGSEIVVRIRHR